MQKETLIKIRKRLHALSSDRDVSLPIRIVTGDGVRVYDEINCCFCWNDSDEIVYIVASNTTVMSTNDNRLLPMEVIAIPYESIMTITAPVDRHCLNHFFEYAVSAGITNETTKQHYFDQVTKLYEDDTYLMGDPSPSTEKTPDPYVNREHRDLPLKDKVVDPNALHML